MSDATAEGTSTHMPPAPIRESLGPVAFMAALFLASIGLAMVFSATFVAEDVRAFEDPESLANPLYYLLIVVAFTVVVLLIAKYGKPAFIKHIILAAVLLTVYTVAWPLLGHLLPSTGPPLGVGVAGIVAATLAVGLTVVLYLYPEWYVINTVGVLIAAGAAGIFGISFGILPSMILLVAFAVYDAIAVYRTRHMLDLADSVLELRLPIMFVVPKTRGYSFLEETAKVKDSSPDEPPREAMFMGLGDAVIPAVLVVSAMTFLAPIGTVGGVPAPMLVALATLAGSFVGFLALMYFVLKGQPHAGLPLLNGGAIAGFLLMTLPLYGVAPLMPWA